jgi:hypothetical protein
MSTLPSPHAGTAPVLSTVVSLPLEPSLVPGSVVALVALVALVEALVIVEFVVAVGSLAVGVVSVVLTEPSVVPVSSDDASPFSGVSGLW